MTICLTGIMFWALAGVSLLRLWRKEELPIDRPRLTVLLSVIVILLSCVFLFRPHEDIFGGEDPGSYLNSSVTYLRQGSLFYTDPLLSKVPVAERPNFLYGDASFGTTKDACLWVRDMDNATIGPRFLPAYPVMMSVVAWINPQLVLYVAPLFALLTAIVLGILAMRLTGQRASAPLVFILYLLNPVTAWNARCPRAEIIAGFFFFLGWALLAGAWKNRQRGSFLDITLSAICLCLAPFFHMAALFGTLPTLAGIVVLVVLGRKEFFICLPVGLLGLIGLMCHTKYITDPYSLEKYFAWFWSFPVLLITTIVVGLLLAYGLYLGLFRKPDSAPQHGAVPSLAFDLSFSLRIGLMLLVVGGILLVFFFRPVWGLLDFLPRKGFFLILTDFSGVMRLISRSQAIAALIGLAVLILRRDESAPSLRLLLAALLPGLFFAGQMSNYMMETRRLMLFVVPLISLSISALVLVLAARSGRWRSVVLIGCTCVLILAAVHGRSQLYTSVDYAGFYRYLEPLARNITQQKGNLLVEYSRIAAPFEHFFGIRTLSLDNERKSNYQAAEIIWQKSVMEKYPGRKAFFLTPFQPPISENFDFIPVQMATYFGSHLRGQREQIPPSRDYSVQLRLYEMRLVNGQSDASAFFTKGTYCRQFDQGHMGLRRFRNLQTRPWSASGRRLGNGQPLELSVDRLINGEPVKEILYFLYLPEKKTPPEWTGITVDLVNSGKIDVRLQHLEDSWWVAKTLMPAGNTECRFTISSEQPALLCQAKARTLHTIKEIEIPAKGFEDEPMAPFHARWARDKAQLLVPVDRENPLELFVYLQGTDISQGHPLNFRMPSGDSEALEVPPNRWQWHVLPVDPNPEKHGRGWVTITTDEPWNPKLENYPPDLAVLVGHIVVVHPKAYPESR